LADLLLNPCPECVSQAAYTKLLMSTDPNDFTASGGAVRLHFLGESISRYVTKRNDQGITGDLWKLANRFHSGQDFIYGPIYFAANAGEMAYLLPHMLGAADGGTGATDFNPDSCAVPVHFLLLRDYGIFKYVDCYAAQWQISSRALRFREESLADMVVLAINWIGKSLEFSTDESAWPVADEPQLGSTAEFTPYFFKHSRFHAGGTNFSDYTKDVSLEVNRNLEPRYRMSTTPTQVCSGQRDVRLDVGMDWNATTRALYNSATNPQGRLRLAMDEVPTYYTDFHFGAIVISDRDPASRQKLEDVEWSIRADGAAVDPSAGTYDIWASNKDS
jgi:hypothetical protein